MVKDNMIVFDADSVLLDWLEGFLSFLETQQYCVNHVKEYIGTTQFIPTSEIIKNSSKEDIKKLMTEFSNSGFLSRLKPFQDNNITLLQELNKTFNLSVVTCIGETEHIIKQRKTNLTNIYGDIFTDIICIDYGKAKDEHLKKLSEKHNIVAFVDDKIQHLEEADSIGINSILLSCGIKENVNNKYWHQTISSLNDIKKYINI